MKDVILCIDRGTSELKAILFDSAGRNCGMEHRVCSILPNRQDWLETDLEETYQLMLEAVKALMEKTAGQNLRVVCISITSYMSGTIFLDHGGKPLGTAVLWNDSRTQQLMQEWAREGVLEKSFAISGSQILTGWPIPLMSWWKRNHPEMLRSADCMLNMKDWLRYQLTGEIMTDVTEAVLGPGDVGTRTYCDEILRLFDVYEYRNLLPPVQEPEKMAGTLLPEAAQAMGLPSGIPVVVGIGDMPGGILGTGTLYPGHGASILGTTFLNGLVIEKPQREPENAGMTSAYVENRLLRLVNNTGGAAINYQWFIDHFMDREKQELGEKQIFNYVDDLIRSVPLGSNGVMYHPYINACGITAPFVSIGARAQFTGIGLHSTKADLMRAIYEGIGFAMRDCYTSIPVGLVDIALTGGGSKSPVLCQISADICGVPIRVPEEKEASALGACIVGAVGVGVYKTYAEAVEHMVRTSKIYEPDQSRTERYSKLYQLYYEIRNDMQPAWEKRQDLYH